MIAKPDVGGAIRGALLTADPAAKVMAARKVARDWLGDTFVEHFALTREWEWRQWQDAVTDWELKRYFEII